MTLGTRVLRDISGLEAPLEIPAHPEYRARSEILERRVTLDRQERWVLTERGGPPERLVWQASRDAWDPTVLPDSLVVPDSQVPQETPV